jgi:DNA replication protein DnaC
VAPHIKTSLAPGSCIVTECLTKTGLLPYLEKLGFAVLYTRTTRLLQELRVAHGDDSFSRRLAALARIDVLALDDFADAPMEAGERNDLLELLDDRVGAKATLITSQLAVKAWHAWLDDPTVAARSWTASCTARTASR